MELVTPEVKKVLEDYDILFQNGFMMPITIDQAKGDSISFGDKNILVVLTSKPSTSNPDHMLPAEDITIYTPHVLSVQHRTKEIIEPSPDEVAERVKTWQELTTVPESKTIQ